MMIEEQDHVNAFHNLMVFILQRRELFRAFEKNLIGKKITPQTNSFVSFYIMDYTRAQLIDLRKFFETDQDSFKISFLTKKFPPLKQKHDLLFLNWKENFEKQTNKKVAHLEQNSTIPDFISKKDLDPFIDNMNKFIDEIVETYSKEYDIQGIIGHRDINGEFLNKEQEESFKDYLKMAFEK